MISDINGIAHEPWVRALAEQGHWLEVLICAPQGEEHIVMRQPDGTATLIINNFSGEVEVRANGRVVLDHMESLDFCLSTLDLPVDGWELQQEARPVNIVDLSAYRSRQ